MQDNVCTALFYRWNLDRRKWCVSLKARASSTSWWTSLWAARSEMKWGAKRGIPQQCPPSCSMKTSTAGWGKQTHSKQPDEPVLFQYVLCRFAHRAVMVCSLSLHRTMKCSPRPSKQTRWSSSWSWHEESCLSCSILTTSPHPTFLWRLLNFLSPHHRRCPLTF